MTVARLFATGVGSRPPAATISSRSASAPDGFLLPARGFGAVNGPGDGLEQRSLPCPIRSDDPGQPGLELDERIGVLAEVAEAQAPDKHQMASPAEGSSGSANSSTPSDTNLSRGTRSGSGRRRR